MRRTLLVVTVAAMAGAVLIFSRARAVTVPVPSAPLSAGVPAETPAASVRVEHQLVTAKRSNPAFKSGQSRPAPARLATAKRAQARNEGFFSRARRVLFGAGRHKPEPFPQAR